MNRRLRRAASCAIAVAVSLVVSGGEAAGQTPYKLPPQDVVDLVDAPLSAQALVSPANDAVLLVEPEAYPPIAFLAQPLLRWFR